MSGEDKPQRFTELGQSTVVRLSIALAVVIAVAAAAVKLGSIDEKISRVDGSSIERRLTTIEVTNINIERRIANMETEIKFLSAAKRAETPSSHLVRPTSEGTGDKLPLPQLFPIQWPP